MKGRNSMLLTALFQAVTSLTPLESANFFNSVSSYLDVWSSSIQYSTASIVPASIPAGQVLYFLDSSQTPPNSTETTRFFADAPAVLDDAFRSENTSISTGFLHQYRTARQLNLLYFDGLSGASTHHKATEVQRFVTAWNATIPVVDEELMDRVCGWTQEKVDGFLRMGADLEIILCNGTDGLNWDTTTRVPSSLDRREHTYEHLRRASMRNKDYYSNILNLKLYPEHMVSAYGKDFVHLAESHNRGLSLEVLRGTNRTYMINEYPAVLRNFSRIDSHSSKIDWHRAILGIVDRFADRLEMLERTPSPAHFRTILHTLALPHYNQTDSLEENKEDCVLMNLPPGFDPMSPEPYERLLLYSTANVLEMICNTLLDLRVDIRVIDGDLDVPRRRITELKDSLHWPRFIHCAPASSACDYPEICMVPLYPFGLAKQDRNPRCTSIDTILHSQGDNFWRTALPKEPKGPFRIGYLTIYGEDDHKDPSELPLDLMEEEEEEEAVTQDQLKWRPTIDKSDTDETPGDLVPLHPEVGESSTEQVAPHHDPHDARGGGGLHAAELGDVIRTPTEHDGMSAHPGSVASEEL